MEFIFEKIFVPQKHSFISRKLPMGVGSEKIHSHKNFELNFIVSGSGRRIIGNNISTYEPGDLVLIGPEVPHNWQVGVKETNQPTCIVTHFYENIISSDFFNIPELDEVRKLLGDANKGILFKGRKVKVIAERLERVVNLKGLDAYIELLNVFNLLLQIEDREHLSLVSHNISFDKDLDRINKIYEYVFENIQDGISLDHAAELVNMAPGSFCRYFKKKTKFPFMQYVKNVRIGIAAKMLLETDKQITQICYDSGYNNPANFNHYFKKIMGKTPTEYRNSFV